MGIESPRPAVWDHFARAVLIQGQLVALGAYPGCPPPAQTHWHDAATTGNRFRWHPRKSALQPLLIKALTERLTEPR